MWVQGLFPSALPIKPSPVDMSWRDTLLEDAPALPRLKGTQRHIPKPCPGTPPTFSQSCNTQLRHSSKVWSCLGGDIRLLQPSRDAGWSGGCNSAQDELSSVCQQLFFSPWCGTKGKINRAGRDRKHPSSRAWESQAAAPKGAEQPAGLSSGGKAAHTAPNRDPQANSPPPHTQFHSPISLIHQRVLAAWYEFNHNIYTGAATFIAIGSDRLIHKTLQRALNRTG